MDLGLLLGHVAHQLIWLLYVPPVAVVILAIIRSYLSQRREEREKVGAEPDRD